MSYPYRDQGGYGIPSYPAEQSSRQQRRMPQSGPMRPSRRAGHGSAGPQRGPPPVRPSRPGAAPLGGGRYLVPPHQQQYFRPMPPPPPPIPQEPAESLYDGSAYGEPEYVEESEHWPLPSRPPPSQQQSRGNVRSQGPRQPPQRPQRPDYEQSVQDPARPRVAPADRHYQLPPPPPPSHHGSGQWTGDSYSSPSVLCPQAPQPSYAQGAFTHAQKRPPLGPPPSARRGPASYYPQVGPVHPIEEESDSARGSVRHGSIGTGGGHESMRSYPSSSAIPIGIPDYYLRERDSVPSVPGTERPVSAVEGEFREQPGMPPSPLSPQEEEFGYEGQGPSPEPATLIRHASLGRKSKPTLTHVKSSENFTRTSGNDGLTSLPSHQREAASSREPMPMMAQRLRLVDEDETELSDGEMERYEGSTSDKKFGNVDKALGAGGAAAVAAAAVGARKDAKDDVVSQRTSSSDALRSGTGLLDPSSSESEKEKDRPVKKKSGGELSKKPSKELLGAGLYQQPTSQTYESSPLSKEIDDPRMSEILAELEKGGALSTKEADRLKKPTGGLSERAGKRRPPPLNVDAVKDAEARGSLTSLPDLIKRATRLASNLDRGRTASRLGMQMFLDGEDGDDEKNARRKSGISDILASFPPPGLATPPGSRSELRNNTGWSRDKKSRHSHLPSESDAGEFGGRRRRRCCGMPLWIFLLLLTILVLLVAAAVVVPVCLTVLPKDDDSGNASGLSACEKKLTCQNGGVNVISSSGMCQCLCVNGYTGSMCGTAGSAGCTTTNVGSMSDATVGDAIPRLLSGASNFSIALDDETILGLFSGNDLSCNSENALVTFNNNAGAKRSLDEDSGDLLVTTPTLLVRQASTSSAQNNAATSDGIVYDAGSPSSSSSSSSAISSATASASKGTPSATSSSSASTSSSASQTTNSTTTLDFARVTVLYILQTSGRIDPAIKAQDTLQSYFYNGQSSSGQDINASNISLGNGYSCDLNAHRISLQNGTMVGGGG